MYNTINYSMTVTKLFINGCSFLTYRPRLGVNTHCGLELAKEMKLDIACNLAGGGRGSKRLMWTTRAWCEKFPDVAKRKTECAKSQHYGSSGTYKDAALSAQPTFSI